eukprot:scaffold1064_cov85-Amphora_coffeaeformis.AAC.16
MHIASIRDLLSPPRFAAGEVPAPEPSCVLLVSQTWRSVSSANGFGFIFTLIAHGGIDRIGYPVFLP